jgi:hydrogenase expression/formation protein HypE
VCFVPASEVEETLAVMHAHPLGTSASCIGTVTADMACVVTKQSRIGVSRLVDMQSGEHLPRIC